MVETSSCVKSNTQIFKIDERGILKTWFNCAWRQSAGMPERDVYIECDDPSMEPEQDLKAEPGLSDQRYNDILASLNSVRAWLDKVQKEIRACS
jgi:hypothetical protein